MTPKVNLVPLKTLLSSPTVVENFSFDGKPAALKQRNASFEVGYHLYVEIGLTLKLDAAEDDPSGLKFLRIIEQFAQIAEKAADLNDGQIFEVQGRRIHIFVGATKPQDAIVRLLTIAYSIVNEAYDKLSKIAGDSWQGCKATADHGPAVILISEIGGNTVVSLGNAANRPAKKLSVASDVNAGHLAMPENLMPSVFKVETSKGWKQISLLEPNEILRKNVEMEKRASLAGMTFKEFAHKKITAGNTTSYDAFVKNSGFSPFKIQGYCLRADLDGFSKQVEEAFQKGPQAITQLVERFQQLLDLPETYKSKFRAGQTLIFPWAGDCATLVILPNIGEQFSKTKLTLPPTSALAWHQLTNDEKRYLDSVGVARWAVGIAAGDDEDGNEGRMLVTQIKVQGRTFKILAGWASCRSNEAYQLEGIRGCDTVLPEPDYQGLIQFWKDAFSAIAGVTTFKKASQVALEKAQFKKLETVAKPAPVATSAAIFVPQPRSYYGE